MAKRFLIFFIAFGFIVTQTTAVCSATTAPLSLESSPLPIKFLAVPGQVVSSNLRIKNSGNQTEDIKVSLNMVRQDEIGAVDLVPPTQSDVSAKWVKFSEDRFKVKPKESHTIKLTINIPDYAAFGYYYAVQFSRYSGVQAESGRAVAGGALATFVLLNVDVPGGKIEAKVDSFKTSKSVYEFLPSTFLVDVKSTGNVHVAPHGDIFIYKGNKQVGSLKVNEFQSSILPNAGTLYSVDWTDGFPRYEPKYNDQLITKADGTPEKSLKWNFTDANKFRFGKYTAKLVMVYDDGQKDVPIQATVSFWVIPWRILAVVFLFLVLIGFGVWTITRKIIRLSRLAKRADQNLEAD